VKAVLDTQVKNRKFAGDYGYVLSAKKYNLKLALSFLGICIIVYLIGVVFFDKLAPFFTIGSVLLILPASQFLAKYLSYATYKTINSEQFEKIESISEDFLVLGELPIIRGKKVYTTLVTVVTKVGVYSYIDPRKDISESRKVLLDTEHALNSILKPKNLGVTAKIYNDFDDMYDYLRTTIKSIAVSPDEKKLGEIAKLYITKTH